ncbi:DNA-binding response regulator [Paracidovorax avenae]|uniref:Two component transcriptional regulator, winged helix family n=1 Tax=Paracidovorax avenae (strain ATCC 19860 / DSM 7227 / CCUG 15838 / JCM 20985 / LMG 2117 / NCPPB 1011) TaxID=643561 RepID=F0Q3S5_PARA1|nr:response regulator [Paracidovorax avenae]ADX45453.1 two component transcriptional regulator, winged helix family [Paracidovorax avenae ATCC 19860]AVS61561.1 DNA-binding response regulator [Paracidovorax avenae]AVS68315.1 DNA-binding response regulator [Paracidovorax avenae]
MNDDPQRILVVEDEPDIADVVLDYLRHSGFEAEHVADGHAAIARLTGPTPPDLTLLDIMLPGMDGLEVLRQARRRTDRPIIMLTARVEEVDRLIGLELGADDYICKPFSPREVVARVRTVLRRSTARPSPAAQDAPLVLDEAFWQVHLRGTPVSLTPREFRLLQALASHSGRIFSRAQLLDMAYDDTLDVNERAIDSHIKNLRRKLRAADGSDHEWIRSVYGVGFSLEPPQE